MRSHEKIELYQKRIFKAIQSEVDLYQLKKSKELSAYENSFNLDIPKSSKKISTKKLISFCGKADFVFVGDFHTFKQSQKGYLRLITNTLKIKKKINIALECVQSRYQPALNSYLKRDITLDELREEIRFERHWPFDWNNYKEIFEFSQKNKISILALNTEKDGKTTLKSRDIFAANILGKNKEDGVTSFILYGELHLAQKHLPLELKRVLNKKVNIIIIHQNLPKVFWKSPKNRSGERPESLKLKKNMFCIQNAVPWTKLKSYLDWIEGNNISEDDTNEDDQYISVKYYQNLLTEILRLDNSSNQEIDSIFLSKNTVNTKSIRPKNTNEKLLLQYYKKFNRPVFLIDSNIALLTESSTNTFAEISGLLTWKRSVKNIKANTEENALIFQFFLGYFASKILNPKRKCNEIDDLQAYIKMNGSKKAYAKKVRIYKYTLNMLRAYFERRMQSKHEKSMPKVYKIESARLAGYILAERFFNAIQNDSELFETAANLFKRSTATEKWAQHVLNEISSIIRKKKVVPISKFEKL